MHTNSPSGWRRYNIFLSSTFKDMDFERDVIRFRVIPALNRRFRDRRVELQAIDLRLGVNTSDMSEAESERKVLSVCTSCIDSARPFFVGLIGRRYGWVPPVERWKEFISGLSEEDREILKDTAGCSVTEMEIVYGALSQGSFDSSHVLFYLRDDASYDGIPEGLKPTFCDSNPEALGRLDTLKKRVRELFGKRGGEDDRCSPYHLVWEDGHFSSEEFEILVTEQLAKQIELEARQEEEAGSATWWMQEKELEESTLLRLLPGSVETELDDDPDENKSKEENPSDRVVWYVQGIGASTHMAQEYADWAEDADVVRLLAVFGLSEYSNAMRPVLARWIHELALVTGREDLPDDELLLGKMPEPELNTLFASLVQEVLDADKYIYIFLDDVEALETTSPKDLFMPWLDRVADRVNILVNLQDGSEARAKFLSAHDYPARMMAPGIQDSEDAEVLISRYEQTYFLELPAAIRKAMLDAADDNKDCLLPIKVHSVFRLFESLTLEDFKCIRSAEGSQIDAINSYLEEIWSEIPDSPYDLMTFMVNHIGSNLGLGEKMLEALWVVASAPGGLRESDIAYFAGDDWDVLQFYRSMNFLYDFFYEDRGRHLWRAKYISRVEDGLRGWHKSISEYLLTLDREDSLRETMGLYYALSGGDPSHYAPYLMEGDYAHGPKMKELVRIHGPQIRQLYREGWLGSREFEKYCKALDAPQRLQLMMVALTALADLQEERMALGDRMATWLDDIDVAGLSAPDAFSYAGLVGHRPKSIPYLERGLQAARLCVGLDYPDSQHLFSGIAGLLVMAYRKMGLKAKAAALAEEVAGLTALSAKDRFTALQPLLMKAYGRGLFVSRKQTAAALDQFLTEYYAIVDSLELNDENFTARFWSGGQMNLAFQVILGMKDYDRLLEELVRFLPSMQLFCCAPNFFSNSKALEMYVQYHSFFVGVEMSLEDRDDEAVRRIGMLGQLAMFEAGERLKEIDPDNVFIKTCRSYFASSRDVISALREQLGVEDVELKDLDELIKEQYESYVSTHN